MANTNEERENPYTRANIISKITFWWMNKLFKLGASRPLEAQDIYRVLPSDSSEILGRNLAARWEAEIQHCKEFNHSYIERFKPSLGKVLVHQFRARYMLVGTLVFVEECIIRMCVPVCLGYLIRYFDGEYSALEGYLLAAAIVFGTAFYIFTHHPFFFSVQHVGMQVQVASCALIYRKALRLSQMELCHTTIWHLVNLLSSDVNHFDRSTIFLHYLWVGPIQTVIVTCILWTLLGPSCLVGIGVLVTLLFFQGFMGKRFAELRAKAGLQTVSRLRIMNEILNGMRDIKMHTWEKAFVQIIDEVRRREVRTIRKSSFLRALNLGISYVSVKIMVLLTLVTFALSGHHLTAEKVFVTLALYNTIRPVMTLFFPAAISLISEAKVSVGRIEEFLLLREWDAPSLVKDEVEREMSSSGDAEQHSWLKCVFLNQFCGKWDLKRPCGDTLQNVNLSVGPGELVCLVGPVGSGKGSILQAILKELPPTSGGTFVHGSIAYYSQVPWMYAGTIKENILFGNAYLEESSWYQDVIEACALTSDLEMLPLGDETYVDEQGSGFSSGFKARISLARAVYADKDIYLLDDPLSAVEAEVGRHIFEKCINGILKDKLRILVTHQVQFLNHVRRIVVVYDGRVIAEGTYDQVIKTGLHQPQIKPLTSKISLDSNLSAGPGQVDTGRARINSLFLARNRNRAASTVEGRVLGQVIPVVLPDDSISLVEGSDDPLSPNVKNSDDDVQKVGCQKCTTYYEYFHAGSNGFNFAMLVVINLLTMTFFTAAYYWLKVCSRSEYIDGVSIPGSYSAADKLSIPKKFIIYAVLVVILIVLSIGRSIFFFHLAMKSSVQLHDNMVKGIFRAPMKFFESTPVDKILNRFGKGIGVTDETLPHTYMDAIEIFLTVIGVMIIIGIVNTTLLIPAALLLVAFYFLRRYYMFTAPEIRKIEAAARTPVFTHLSATLQGLTTIRAYGAENELIRQFDERQDFHTASWFLFIATTRWFGIWLDWIIVLYLTLVIFSFMFGLSFNDINGTVVGLVVSMVMMFTGMCEWGVRQSMEVENQMISVSRILEYAETEPEAPWKSKPGQAPNKNWPSKGEISFTNLSLQSEEILTLRDINCHINSCEKVGIVSRSRDSKISLINLLFRIVEPSTGDIKIDNLNILHMGLQELRSKLSIIPQEPILFEQTLRANLDPYNNHTDSEIWQVLKDVSLYQIISQEPDGLEQEISGGAKDFSIASKQLISIGRAVLEHTKIVVIDEPTVKLDTETDVLIQKTIRHVFKNCTVITVAHRLSSVIDSDRIMVLSDGLIEEFGAPWTLLKDKKSALYRMAEETGKTSLAHLMKISKHAWESKTAP